VTVVVENTIDTPIDLKALLTGLGIRLRITGGAAACNEPWFLHSEGECSKRLVTRRQKLLDRAVLMVSNFGREISIFGTQTWNSHIKATGCSSSEKDDPLPWACPGHPLLRNVECLLGITSFATVFTMTLSIRDAGLGGSEARLCSPTLCFKSLMRDGENILKSPPPFSGSRSDYGSLKAYEVLIHFEDSGLCSHGRRRCRCYGLVGALMLHKRLLCVGLFSRKIPGQTQNITSATHTEISSLEARRTFYG